LGVETSTSGTRTNMVATIPNISPSLGEVFYEDSGGSLNFEQIIENVQGLSNISFEMRDSFGNVIEMQRDWIMGLEITRSDYLHVQKLRDYLNLTK